MRRAKGNRAPVSQSGGPLSTSKMRGRTEPLVAASKLDKRHGIQLGPRAVDHGQAEALDDLAVARGYGLLPRRAVS